MLLFRLFTLSCVCTSVNFHSLSVYNAHSPYSLIPLFLLNIYHSFFIHIQVKMRLSGENAALNPREENCGLHQSSSLTNREKLRQNCDKYSQWQTLIACQQFEAAQRKDERLLLQIKDKDLVGLEVCYHCICYNEYVPKARSIGWNTYKYNSFKR